MVTNATSSAKNTKRKSDMSKESTISKRIMQLEEQLAKLRQLQKNPKPADKTEFSETSEINFQPDFFSELCAFAPIGIFVADSAGNGIYTNSRWQEISGISFEKSLGLGWIQAVHQDDRFKVYTKWRRAAKQRQPFELEFRLRRPDDSIRYVRTVSQPIIKDASKVEGYVGAVEDISEEVALRNDLAAEQNLTSGILEQMPVAVFVTKVEDGKVLYVAGHTEEILKFPRERYMGKNAPSFYSDPEDRNQLFEQLRNHGVVKNFELQVKNGKGELVWVGAYVKRIEYAAQPCILTVITEIAQRKNMEAELQRQAAQLQHSNQALRKILDSVPVAIGISSAIDGKVLYANQNTADMAETTLNQIIGHTVGRFYYDPQDRERLIAKLSADGHVTGFETRFKTATGKIRWVHYSLSRTEFEDKPAMLAALVDITETRAASEQLREAQSFAQLGRWELDLTTNVLTWSDTMYEIFEIDQTKFGASYEAFLNIIHPDDRERLNEAYLNSLETKTPYEIEHRLLIKDGRIKWVVEACRTDYDDTGKAIRSVGITQDITKRKETLNALHASIAKIRDLETALHVHSIVAVTDGKGLITLANDEFCRISGYSREELLGQDHRLLNSGYHPKEFFREMWDTIRDGRVWKGVIKNRAKNGSFYWVNTTIVPFFGEGEKPYQYIAIRVDITAQKEAEEALRQSEAHFRRVTEDSPVYISVFLSDGTLTFVNPALAALVNKKPRELVGQNFLQFLAEEERARAVMQLRALTPDDPVSSREQKLILPNGDENWQLWTNRAFFNESGKLINFQGFGQDITALKKAERELRHAQRRVNTTLNTMIDGMVEVNLKGEIVYANRGAERILGITLNKITGQYFQSREWRQINADGKPYPPEKQPLAIALRECREVGPVEHPLAGNNGEWKWISVYAAPLLNSAGELYGAVATFRDTTERVEQAEAMRASEERFRKIFELSPVGILEYDIEGAILTANPKLCEVYGATPEQLVGINLFDTITQEDMLLALRNALTGKPSDVESDYRSVISGKSGYLRSVFSPVKDGDGRVKGGVIISEDVTARRQAEVIARERESYKMLFEQAAVGVVLVDALSFRFCRVNRRFAEILGYTVEELADGSFRELTHPDDLKTHVEPYEAMVRGEISEFSLEKRYLHKSGRIVWALITVGRTWNPGEQPTRHITVIQDITDRKLAEAAHERSRILHSTLMVMTNMADSAINGEDFGRGLLVLAGKTLGLRKMLLLKLSLSEGLLVKVASDSDDAPMAEGLLTVPMGAFVRHQIDTGEDLIFTDWQGGETIPLPGFFAGNEVKLSLLMAEPDLPLHLVWAVADAAVTGDEAEAQFLSQFKSILTSGLRRLHNEKFFASSSRLYQSVIASMNDIHWVSSPGGDKVYYVNPAFEVITGYTTREFIRNPDLINQCIVREDRSLYAESINGTKHAPVDFVVRITRKDGAQAWLRIRTSPLKNPGGKVERKSFIATDVTAEKNRDLMRQQFHLELIELQENDRAEFARELHDCVGQNLIILKFVLERLKKKLPETDQDSLMKGLSMISEIIDNNRNISRRISPFHIEKLGLRAAIEDLLEKINLDGRYHVTAELNAIEGFFPDDWSMQLYRIVQECLTNIMKHSAAKHIGIHAATDSFGLHISITNDGLRVPDASVSTGIGRRIMDERAALIKAKITTQKIAGRYEVQIAIQKQSL